MNVKWSLIFRLSLFGLVMAVAGPMVGVASGVIIGTLCQIAARLLRPRTAR